MFGGVSFIRHSLLNSGLKPCTITLMSNVGVRGGFPSTLISGNTVICQRLASTLPAKACTTTWKPFNDPKANRETFKRLIVVGSLTGIVLGIFVYVLYSMKFNWPSDPPRIAEIRKHGIGKV